jgi:hypothetical protein
VQPLVACRTANSAEKDARHRTSVLPTNHQRQEDVVPGGTLAETGLFTALHFIWNGITYTQKRQIQALLVSIIADI